METLEEGTDSEVEYLGDKELTDPMTVTGPGTGNRSDICNTTLHEEFA